jgi:hypothetical protein
MNSSTAPSNRFRGEPWEIARETRATNPSISRSTIAA